MRIYNNQQAGAGILVVLLTAIGVGAFWPLDFWGFVLAGLFALAGIGLFVKSLTRPDEASAREPR